jgi:hypothetical protein
MQELAKNFYSWAETKFNIAGFCGALSVSDKRETPQIALESIAKEILHMGFFQSRNINEHFLRAGSTVNNICSQGYFYQLASLLSFEGGREHWWSVLKRKKQEHFFDEFSVYGDKLLLFIDGWESNGSYKKCCPDCLHKELGDGKIWYYHRYVFAVIVHPVKPIAILLDIEPSLANDSSLKQDCEINQTKRMLKRLHENVPNLWDIVLIDGIYPKSTILNPIKTAYKKDYICVLKDERTNAYEEADVKAANGFKQNLVTDKESITVSCSHLALTTLNNIDHPVFPLSATFVSKKKTRKTSDIYGLLQ